MVDSIDRHEAIDAVRNIIVKEVTPAYMLIDKAEVMTELMMMQSAQPEIVRCKDCRHGVDYYHEGDCYCSNPKWGLTYFGGSWEFYCADAERRTDEND